MSTADVVQLVATAAAVIAASVCCWVTRAGYRRACARYGIEPRPLWRLVFQPRQREAPRS